MSDGPKKIKPDYKGMWQNYSGWIREENSRAERLLSQTRAKLGMQGVKEGSSAWNTQIANVQKTLDKDRKTITSGSTSKALQDKFTQALGGYGKTDFGKGLLSDGLQKSIDKYGIDHIIAGYKKDMDTLKPIAEAYKKAQSAGSDAEGSGMDLVGGMASWKYSAAKDTYHALTAAKGGLTSLKGHGYDNASVWEGYMASQFGTHGFVPPAETPEEKAEKNAGDVGGGQQVAIAGQSNIGGSQASPWMNANKPKPKDEFVSPNL